HDEAMAKVGTYLKSNDLSSSDNNDRFFYIILNELRQKYAPTVEMGHQQAKIFASYYHPEKPLNKNKFDYPDSLIMKSISEKDLVQAWLHPETIKVIGENNDTATSSRNED
ncbi:hypothetical protein, partial [Leuconostoc citreum]